MARLVHPIRIVSAPTELQLLEIPSAPIATMDSANKVCLAELHANKILIAVNSFLAATAPSATTTFVVLKLLPTSLLL